MSPRRRLLLAGLALVVLAALGAAAAALVVADRKPSRASAGTLTPGPVLLVPGYGGGTGGLDLLAARLRAAGRQATVVHLPGGGTGDLDKQADVLDAAAGRALAGGAASVDVVGYSAGGVVARLWARDHGGAARARLIVTLGAPHHGTDLAAVAGVLAPGSCPAACRELAPGGPLLAGLNAGDETPDGPVWVSVWTTQDEVVTPPDSARLDGAHNVVVQRVCPGRQISHTQLPADPVVQGLVLRALAPTPYRAPRPADCAALSAGR